MYRKGNYVLGATNEVVMVEAKKKLPIMIILGGAAVMAFLGRKANRAKNALIGGAAAFAVGHFMAPKVSIVVDGEEMPPVDDTEEQEDEF